MEVIPTTLDIQKARYKQYLESRAKDESNKPKNTDEFTICKNFLKSTQILCYKYNTSLDKKVQK